MGQHTWFYKDQGLREKEIELLKKIDDHESDITWLDDLEIYQVEHEIKKIRETNKTEYHDLFRTNKMYEDGTYIDDVIRSKEECNKWLEENKETISFKYFYNETEEEEEQHRIESLKSLNEFWEKYPNGFIDFG
jgi:hypothetical protein